MLKMENFDAPAEVGGEKMIARSSQKKPNPTDVHVGSRIRLRRNMLGMSQEKLGESLGITFQQIQKYEKGTNRVGASRIQAIATILGVPVSYFFEETTASGQAEIASEDLSATSAADFCSSPEGLQLNRAFVKIGDVKVRRKIIELVRTLSAERPE